MQPTAYIYFTACGSYLEVCLSIVPLHFLVNKFRHSKVTSLPRENKQSRLDDFFLNKSNVGQWQLFMEQPNGPKGMFELVF